MPKVIGYDPVDLGYGGMINYSGADNNKVLDDVKDGDYPTVVVGDPNWDDTILSLNFDDNITDLTGTFSTYSLTGSYNADAKFGTKSLRTNGSGGLINTSENVALSWGTSDFTIEWWYKHSTWSGGNAYIFHGRINNGDNFIMYVDTSGNLNIYDPQTGGVGVYTIGVANTLLTAGTWQHMAVVKTSNVLKVFIDGSQVGTDQTQTESFTLTRMGIGSYGGGTGFLSTGLIDSFRITTMARYTANFTPPIAEFPTS